MKKYLDITGLSELWRRISTAFATKSDVEDGIAESIAEGGAVRGAIDASMERLSRVSETGSYLDLSDKPTAGLYRQISVRVLQGIDKLYIDGAGDLIAAGCQPVLFRYCRKRNKVRRGTSREGVAQGKHEKWKKGWNAMGGQGTSPVTAAVKIEQDDYGHYLCIAPKQVWGKDTNYGGWWHKARLFIHQKNTVSASFSGRSYALREATNGETVIFIRRFTYGVAFVKPTDNPYKAGTNVIDKSRLASNIAPFRLCYLGGKYNEEQTGMGFDETPEGVALDAVNFSEDGLAEDTENSEVGIVLGHGDCVYLPLTTTNGDEPGLWVVMIPGPGNDPISGMRILLGGYDLVEEVNEMGTQARAAETFEAEYETVYADGAFTQESVSLSGKGYTYAGYNAINDYLGEGDLTTPMNWDPCFLNFDYTEKNIDGWHWCFGK